MSVAGMLVSTYDHQRASQAVDSQGGFVTTWPSQGNVSGMDSIASAREQENAQQALGNVDTVVYVGASESIERDDRLVISSRTLRVKGIFGDSRRTYLKLLCEEIVEGN